jgi:hypothetical protein
VGRQDVTDPRTEPSEYIGRSASNGTIPRPSIQLWWETSSSSAWSSSGGIMRVGDLM